MTKISKMHYKKEIIEYSLLFAKSNSNSNTLQSKYVLNIYL